MTNRKHLLIVACLVVALSSVGNAENSADSLKLFRPATMKTFRMALIPFVSSGIVIGDASDRIEQIENNYSSRLLWSGGVSFIYLPKPQYSVGINLEHYIKPLPGGYDTFSGWIFSGSFALYSGKFLKAIPYVRAAFGLATGKYPDFIGDEDVDFGTHAYYRLGAGIYSLISSSRHFKLEVFYSRAETVEHEFLDGSAVSFTAERVGLEIGIGFPLMSD